MEILIWLIILIAIGVSRSKKVTNAGKNTTQQVTVKRPVQQQKKNFADMPVQRKTPPNVERNCAAEDKHRSENNVYQKRTTQATVPNVKRAYTEADKRTRTEKHAKRMIARRLYEGDPVPQGYRVVKCGYCAAENLIAYSSRGDYMCYFCHEDI